MALGLLLFAVMSGGGAAFFFRPQVVGGLLAGAGLMYINLLWLARLVRELLQGKTSGKRFGLKLALKYLVLFGAVTVLIAFKVVDAVGFLVGLSGLLPTVLVVGIRWQRGEARRKSQAPGEAE